MKNSYKLETLLWQHVSPTKIANILNDTADIVLDDIKSLAPIDTGTYRNSIKKSEVKNEGLSYEIKIFSNLDSGWNGVALGYLLEYGTGIKGEASNSISHGHSYRQTPWVYYNERYGRFIFTHGNIARPHFYTGLHLNEDTFKNKIMEEISHD